MWTYDKVGNRLTQAVSNYDGIGVPGDSGATGVLKSTFNTSYVYNSNDWLTSTTSIKDDDSGESTFTTNFEYNANGSQTAVTTNVGTPDEKKILYFYDFEQKLTGIGNPTDTIKHAYTYDAEGNRIAESNISDSGIDIRSYLVDPNVSNAQIVEEYDDGNTLLAHYDWNDAELLREATRTADESTFTIREPLVDGHNSARQLLDSIGAISDIYAFDAWGNQQENIGGSFNPYRYNTQRLDASGLYYLRARQYSSGLGRFLTHDSMMGNMNNPITQHRYLYAGDDAINFEDPSGQEMSLPGQIAALSIGTTLVNIGNTLYADYRIGQHFAKGKTHPDAFYIYAGAGYQAKGIYGGGMLAAVVSLRDGEGYHVDIFGGGELAFSPLSWGYPKLRGEGIVYGFGFLFNSEDNGDFGGIGISANWPLAMASYVMPLDGEASKWKAFNETLYQRIVSRSWKVKKNFGTVQIGWSWGNGAAFIGYAARVSEFSANISGLVKLTPSGTVLEDMFQLPGLNDFVSQLKGDVDHA